MNDNADRPKNADKGGDKLDTHIHTLTTKQMGQAFELWAASRGMSRSKALRGLMTDALWREAHGQPLGPLYGDLPPKVLDEIVADLQARLHA